jgi:hypothetical protein
MGINDYEITITEAEKLLAKMEREEEEAIREIEELKKMTFGERLREDKKTYERVYNTQLDTMKKKLKDKFTMALFNEFWDLLLNDKIDCMIRFFEIKKIKIEEKEDADKI